LTFESCSGVYNDISQMPLCDHKLHPGTAERMAAMRRNVSRAQALSAYVNLIGTANKKSCVTSAIHWRSIYTGTQQKRPDKMRRQSAAANQALLPDS
jgi:hypothetical protein